MDEQSFKPPRDARNPRICGPKIVREHPEIRTYAELGVLYGSSACAVAEAMEPGGDFHLFDFEDMLDRAKERVQQAGLEDKHRWHFHGNSRRLKDSYNWSLLRLLEEPEPPVFDYVFLDGAHTYDVDGLAFFLVDLLMRKGSYLELDDYHWRLSKSPTMGPRRFPAMAEWYTREQLKTAHVAQIVRLLVEPSGRYEAVRKRRLYRRAA